MVKQKTASSKKKSKPKKGQFKMISAFSILLIIIAVLILVSWILYWAGVGNVEALGILDLFVAPIKGFIDKAEIIVFIMVVGAFVYMVIASKTLEAVGQSMITRLKGKEIWAIIPLMIFCSVGGSTFGFSEESIGFYLIIVPLMLAAGFDTMTGMLIVLLGAGVGVLTSTVNPFMISVAVDGLNQGITDPSMAMTVGDGLVWRIVCWAIMTTLAIVIVMWYANRVKKTPSRSVTFATAKADKSYFLKNATEEIKMTGRRRATLAIFIIVFIFMIVYLIGWDELFGVNAMQNMSDWIWNNIPYFTHTIPGFGLGGLEFVASFFLLGAIVVGMINTINIKKEPGQTAESMIIDDFLAGVRDIIGVALVIATASGIGFVLVESHIQELIVDSLAKSIGGVNSGIGKILILYLLFVPLSFLIPSSAGFATAVFPLLAGVTKTASGAFDPVVASGSVTAFSFASGLVNLITPTSGVVMGALTISHVDYGKFVKVMGPIFGIFLVILAGLLALGGLIGGNIA